MLFMMMVLTDDQSELVGKLYTDYYGLFYSIAHKILKSEQAAEDAVHTSFAKISEKIEEIAKIPCPQMRAYCIVIVERDALAMIRADKRIEVVESFDENLATEDPSPEELTISQMEQENVKKLLDSLSDDEQEILKLHFYNDLSYRQIADFYDITVEAAKKRGQRAIGALRTLMTRRSRKGI